METNKENNLKESKNKDLLKFNNAIGEEKTLRYLNKVLGSNSEAFITSLVSLVANNDALQKCEPMSVMYAAMKAAALSLPLDSNLGFAYVIPYNGKNSCEAQFQIGYKGLIQLCIRSGAFSRINVTDVREGELKKNDLITGELIIEQMPDREKLPIVGYCAYFRLTNGFEKAEYWTNDKIESHAKEYSAMYRRNAGLWVTKRELMAKKTVLKLLLGRYAPMSMKLQTAIAADQAVFRAPDVPTYVDNKTSRERIAEIAEDAVISKDEEDKGNE